MQDMHEPDLVRRCAHTLDSFGCDWLLYERRSKDPHENGWQRKPSPNPLTANERKNIGVHLRRDLADCDLDAPEVARAAMLAPEKWRLPDTMAWGRDGKPRSHLFYVLTNPHRYISWKDPSVNGPGAKLAEFRIKGQTVAPGSLHESTGELIRWEPDGERAPIKVGPDAIVPLLERTCAIGLITRNWRTHDRHDMAGPLAGFLFHGGMNQDEAEELLRWVCATAGDDEVENRVGWLRDTYRKAQAGEPVTGGPTLVLEECLSEAHIRLLRKWLTLHAQPGSADLLGPDMLPLTGNGDGDRFAALWAGQVIYCPQLDTWYIWDGTRYYLDDVGEIRERAKKVVAKYRRTLGEKQANCGRNGVAEYKTCTRHAVEMDSPGAITAMLNSAKSKDELRVSEDDLDARPDYLNVLDCTVEFDVSTGEVKTHLHRPEDLLTKLAPVHFYPDATHPLFAQHVIRFYPEPERLDLLRQMAGDMIHGYPKLHAFELIGPHGAGKSSTLKLFRAMLGKEYAGSLASNSLEKNPHKGGDVGRPDLWRVRHKRLVVITEMDPTTRMDSTLFKAIISGGDPIGLRTFFDKAGGEDTVFTFSLWMSGNKPYGPPPDEIAAFERLFVLDCSHVVPESDRHATEELALTQNPEVLDAAFAFAVQGFQQLFGQQRGDIIAPESSRQRKAQLMNELDRWTAFFDGSVHDVPFEFTGDPKDGVLKTEAWTWARAFMDQVGWKPRNLIATQAEFESAMERRGAKLTRSPARWNMARGWSGVRWGQAFAQVRNVTLPDWSS